MFELGWPHPIGSFLVTTPNSPARLAHAKHGDRRFPSALVFVVLLLSWTPILLAGWPGYFNYDSGTDYLMQWGQIESGRLNAHHPVLHTLFIEATVKAGQTLFGSFDAGVSVCVMVQALLIAAALTWVLRWMSANGMGRVGTCLSVAYLALDPVISLFAFSTTKDSLFAAAVVLYAANLAAFCRPGRGTAGRASEEAPASKGAAEPGTGEGCPAPKEAPAAHAATGHVVAGRDAAARIATREAPAGRGTLRTVRDLVPLACLTAIVAMLRSNGLVALVVTVPVVLALLARGQRPAYLKATLAGLVAALIWLGPLSLLMGVEKSPIGKWNVLCIPEQQIARAAADPSVSDADRELIGRLLPGIQYKDNLSDVARGAFMRAEAEGTASPKELVGLYLHLARAYPGVYIEAFLAHTRGAWDLASGVGNVYGDDPGATNAFAIRQQAPATRESLAPRLLEWISWLSTSAEVQRTPFAVLLSMPLYLIVCTACLVVAIRRRDRTAGIVMAPLVTLALSNLLGPCMLIRYFLYLFYGLPLMAWVLRGPGAKGRHEGFAREERANAKNTHMEDTRTKGARIRRRTS